MVLLAEEKMEQEQHQLPFSEKKHVKLGEPWTVEVT